MTDLVPLLTEERGVPAGTTRDAADEALAWMCLKDAVGALAEEARQRAGVAMREQASEKQAVLNAAGDRMGTVTLTGGELKAEVFDKTRLLAWVKEHHPTEVYEEVRPAFLHGLLGNVVAQAQADGVISGEVLPGIRVGETEPTLRITKTKVAREMGKEIAARVLGAFEDRTLGR